MEHGTTAARACLRTRVVLCALALVLALILPGVAQKAKKKTGHKASSTSTTQTSQASPAEQGTAASTSGPPEVRIVAESWKSTADNHVIAWGKVEVHYGGVTLFADRVDLNKDTKDVLADGHCVLQSPNEVTTSDTLNFNLDTALGRMERATGMAQPNFFFESNVLEREETDFYHFEGARFTMCTQPNPRWAFSCSRANYKKDDYIEMWNTVLSIKGIPVFYFPYFRYPIQDRQTGFLEPKIGHTNTKGWKYSQDFYLTLGRNMDVTLNFLYYSLMGYGGGVEYRYLFEGGLGGHIKLFDFGFKKGASAGGATNAYVIEVNHNQALPLGFHLVASVDLQSSYDFLRNFDNNFSKATVSNRRSQVFLTNTFSGFTLSAQVSRFETYFQTTNDSIVTEYLPEVSFSSFRIKLFKPLYFSFSSNFSNWQYGWQKDFNKDNQKRLQSASLSPTLSLPFNSIPWLSLTASVSSNLIYYWESFVPLPSNPNLRYIANEPFFTKNLSFVLDLIGPTIYKTYTNAENEPTVKHIIEPFATYRYDTLTPDANRIITANGYYFRYHMITYGLTNHILVKQDKMPREMFTWELSQTHYIDNKNSPLGIYRFQGRIPTVSDITSTLRFFPTSSFSLDVGTSYNTYHNLFSSIRLGSRLGTPQDDVFFNVSWLKSLNPWGDFLYTNRQQVNVFGGLKIPALNIEGQGEFDYNISNKQILFAGADLTYHYQCLDFRANFRVYNFRAKRDFEYSFSFGLGQISHSADFLGGLGF